MKEFVVALLFRMHRMGMLCALRYRNLSPMRYQDKTFMMYSSHALALREVRSERAKTVLDIGCGPGFIASHCRREGMAVTGIDAYPPLPDMMDEFHLVDLEIGEFPVDPFSYDCVLMLDVIEHIADPETLLIALRNRAEPRSVQKRAPLLVISTPNVAFIAVRLNLLLGRFSYAERGILDITHKRLFTRSSLLGTLADCGYAVVKVIPVGAPFQTVVGGSLGKLLGAMADGLARVWPTMFAFQFIVTCRPRPGIRQLMKQDVPPRPSV
jgi:SAM-dependent methyltransferase